MTVPENCTGMISPVCSQCSAAIYCGRKIENVGGARFITPAARAKEIAAQRASVAARGPRSGAGGGRRPLENRLLRPKPWVRA